MRNRWLVLGMRLIVGVVFLWAGVGKILDPLGFTRDIEGYQLFPRAVAFFLAVTLPYIEVACGVLLILGVLHQPVSLIAASLLGGYIVLIVMTMVRGLEPACGCFGSLSGRVGWPLLGQDVGLLFLSVLILYSKPDRRRRAR